MFTLSAFADEIDSDPEKQVAALAAQRIGFIEFRSVAGTNVLSLSDHQLDEFRSLLRRSNIGVSAIGSPIGKTRIDEPMEPQVARLRRAINVAKLFETPNIRIFSFYRTDGATEEDWPRYRGEVFSRLRQFTEEAERSGVKLLHENEHRIFGDSPEHVADLLNELAPPTLNAIHDPANFVVCGHDPWQGWLACRDRCVHFHIKDWTRGETHGRVAGEGQGRIADILGDAVSRGFDGFATLEPHLLGGGPTGGITGPELFPKAVAALRKIIADIGGQES